MDIALFRSPAALSTLRFVEEVTHRVKMALRRREADDPVGYLIRTHRSIHRDGDARAVREAYAVAEQMHEGQFRKSGEPFITHPLAVAEILAELGMDTTTLVAALLHDTVEDTSYTIDQLRADFGAEIATMVDGVTKFEKAVLGRQAEIETYRKMIVLAGSDVRILIMKMADRLHNMRTLGAQSPAAQARIATATQQVIIPLCDRLGIQALKRELEDSLLACTQPRAHQHIADWVARRPDWTAFTDAFIAAADTVLRRSRIGARVVARPHHLYTIWQDTQALGDDTPRELPRVAVIVSGAENDCYTALGAVHAVWRPVPGRFKDYIASPKNNLYRSLHTTVLGPGGNPVEVLIRTEPMHRNAEFGIIASFRHRDRAAHTASGRSAATDDYLEWLRNLVDWQRDAIHPERFIESLRCDLAGGQLRIFVGGERLVLPAASTPVDVAYALGPEVGHRCLGATVNGEWVSLSRPLHDGDVVEIHTAPETEEATPAAEWLATVKSPRAQLEIEDRLHVRATDDEVPALPATTRIRIGRTSVRLQLGRHGRRLTSDLPLHSIATTLGYPDVESLLLAIADHTVPADEIARQLVAQADRVPTLP